MSEGQVTLALDGAVARITFDRPAARNAMTKTMYGQLQQACETIRQSPDIRLAVLRGAGGKAFVAGSDIDIFTSFSSGRDGVAYEAEMERYLRCVADLPMPTIAVIEGWAVGGGLNIAAVCDIRVATPDARFGVPIARTVGNCLSIFSYGRLISGFGASRAKRMLLLGDFLNAEEARTCGFLTDIVSAEAIDTRVGELSERLQGHAPITMRVSKQAIARIEMLGLTADSEDLIEQAYGSKDFQTGVAAFRNKLPPKWEGK